jgi:hypothetical protein
MKRMNSKELLDQAEIRVKRINELSDSVGASEDIIAMLGEGEICFFVSGVGTTHLTPVLSQEKMQKLREWVVSEIIDLRDAKTAELEKLLGIRKPAIINPEFEAAVKDMERTGKQLIVETKECVLTGDKSITVTTEPDPLGEKLTSILQKETKRIADKPVPKAEQPKPESKMGLMTKEDVERMYIQENKTMKEIAEYYGVKKGDVNNFIYVNHLSRKNFKDDGFTDSKPSGRERP